jgi:pectinesterase
LISSLSGPLVIYGYTENTASYADNQVTITASHALADESTDDETGTLRVETSAGFKMYNVDVKNTYGESSSDGQALALSANAKVTKTCPNNAVNFA